VDIFITTNLSAIFEKKTKQTVSSKNVATVTLLVVSAADAVDKEEAEAKGAKAKDGADHEEDEVVVDTALRSGAAEAVEELHMEQQENKIIISSLRPNNNNRNSNNCLPSSICFPNSINSPLFHNQATIGQHLREVPAALQLRWNATPWEQHRIFGVRKTKLGCRRSPRHQPEH
jgi:hypothetical protein